MAFYCYYLSCYKKNKDCWGYVFNLKIMELRASFCGVTHIKSLNLNTLRTSCNGVTHILHYYFNGILWRIITGIHILVTSNIKYTQWQFCCQKFKQGTVARVKILVQINTNL